ncbi:AAA family ATPase [Streptomyces abikoensis]|uniref:AAA family ATPase n=1 Tax=Streptomyces abikoensis TaxID=97398 RepID=UPI0033EA2D9A
MLHRPPAGGLTEPPPGRGGELAALAARAASARTGHAQAVLIGGPSGIGKTRLLRALLDDQAARGVRTLYAACGREPAARRAPSAYEGLPDGIPAEIPGGISAGAPGDIPGCVPVGISGGAAAPYGAVRALFGPLGLTGTGPSPLLRGGAHHALPALASGADTTATPPHQVLHGLYRLAGNLMADRPLTLVLDDAHHADEHSLRWLDFLLRRAEHHLPLLVVLAHRPEAEPVAGAALAAACAPHRTTLLPLGPLGEAEAAELARRILGTPVAPAFAAHLTEASGGNPRTLTHALRTLRAEGAAPDEHGARRAAELCAAMTATTTRRRLGQQPDWVRDVATAVAVLGEDEPQRVAALAGVTTALAEDALTALRRAGLVAPGRAALTDAATRAAVLAPLTEPELTALRTRAVLLLSDAGRPAEEIAEHVLRLPGPVPPWMAATLRDAAARAAARGAHKTAARYLHTVLRAEPDDLSARTELARALAEINPEEALPLIEETLALRTDPRTKAAVAAQYGLTCLALRRVPTAVRVLDEAVAAFAAETGPGAGPADRELTALLESVLLLAGTVRRETIAAVRDRAARMTLPHGDTPAQRQKAAMMSILTALDGRSAARTVLQARRALRSPAAEPGGWAAFAAAFPLALADEVDDALGALDRVLTHGQEYGEARVYTLALAARSLMLHGIGAIPDALADARTAVGLTAEEDQCAELTMPRIVLATSLVDHAEPRRAEEALARVEPGDLDGHVLEQPAYLMARARARRGLGDHEGALALLFACGDALAAAGVANAVLHPWWVHAVRQLTALGRTGEAREIAERWTGPARSWGTPRALGLAAHALAVTTPGPEGVVLHTEAVEWLAGSPARVEHARAEYHLGRALLAAGDQPAAREHLRTAVGLARQCGALALAEAARGGLVTAGGRMRKATGCRTDLLTRTERKVAALARAGASNREIAEALFVTVRTVEMHLTGVYRKLGVGDRAALASALPPEAPPEPPAGMPTVAYGRPARAAR